MSAISTSVHRGWQDSLPLGTGWPTLRKDTLCGDAGHEGRTASHGLNHESVAHGAAEI
ncbi:MAG: hypothetical protein HYY24_11245 [Verrucomicrobia bacterium]|nr:hypothetical protein [Verrucomicrobiota bacterium]